jgi:hypothetical protein
MISLNSIKQLIRGHKRTMRLRSIFRMNMLGDTREYQSDHTSTFIILEYDHGKATQIYSRKASYISDYRNVVDDGSKVIFLDNGEALPQRFIVPISSIFVNIKGGMTFKVLKDLDETSQKLEDLGI